MIENKVIKQDWINLSDLKWIQGNLKKLEPKNFEKLITSIKENGIIKSFHVWQNPSTNETWCLDGNHLKKALEKIKESGVGIPEKVKADFIDCQDEKHAKKLVLLYSAVYANVTESGLLDFLQIEDLDIEDLIKEINLENIDIDNLISGNIGDKDPDDIPEVAETPKTKRGDIYELPAACGGFHRIMCGDSTDKNDVERLMNGENADMVFTDPPYDLEIERILTVFKIAKNYCDLQFWMGSDKQQVILANSNFDIFRKFIIQYRRISGIRFPNQELSKHTLISKFCKTHVFYNLNDGFGTIIEINSTYGKKENADLNQSKKVELPDTFVSHYTKTGDRIIDFFTGTGTVLISAEKNKRLFFGMEIEPMNCDIIIKRYEDFTDNHARLING